MKREFIFIYFVLIFIISCTGNNEKKSDTSTAAKAEIADTSSINKDQPDNYLIDNTISQEYGPVYMYCEKMPEFPGGESAFFDYVRSRVKYPASAVSDKIEGRVVVKFIIKSDGEATDIKIFRGLREDLNNECLRVLSKMPHWKPGMIGSSPVAVSYSVPVRFVLQKGENMNGIYILPPKSK